VLAVLLVVLLTLAWLRCLGWVYHRATAASRANETAAPTLAPASDLDPADDTVFASWLGVSPAGYTRYVDRGLGALAGYLAQHRSDDDQTRPA
jgi:hypothetical protein